MTAPIQHELTVSRRAMACDFSVTLPAATPAAVDAGCAALGEVERLEDKLSVYREESDLSRLNRDSGSAAVDPELYALLRWTAGLSAATGGCFEPACGALVKAWGFYRGPRRVPPEPERLAAMAASGCRHLVFDDSARAIRFRRDGVEFNLGAAGKGYAIDSAMRLLRRRYRIGAALMQGGQSSIRAIGAPPDEPRGWPVALGDPCRPGRSIARIWLRDRALGTSGAAYQFFIWGGQRYGHVLDPRTGWPADALLSASAVAPSAAEADALSTAFFVMGIEGARRFCREHRAAGAVLVAPETTTRPPQIVILGGVDVEVI